MGQVPDVQELTEKGPQMIHREAALSFIALFTLPLLAEDIAVPLEGGKLLIRDVRFLGVRSGEAVPELYFKVENHTKMPWWEIELNFTISATCKDRNRRWVIPASFSVGYSEEHVVGNVYQENYDPLDGKVEGCHTETIRVDLDAARNESRLIFGPERAKKEAAEAARRKRVAAERRQHEEDAAAQAAEQRRKVRAACAVTYQSTADKRVSDLTVREEQQVRACQALGLYPPR